MEARARAAVARLQELPAAGGDGRRDGRADGRRASTARRDRDDQPHAAARPAHRRRDHRRRPGRGRRVAATARDEAAATSTAPRGVGPSCSRRRQAEARRAGEAERVRAESEVQSLLARREFLESDVDQLERFLVAPARAARARRRRRAHDIVERVPGGLGECAGRCSRRPPIRPPVDSAAAGRGRRRRAATARRLDDDRRVGRRPPTSEPTRGRSSRRRVRRRPADDGGRALDDRTAPCGRRATTGGDEPAAVDAAVPGCNGVDEAITSEPPEERRSRPLSRTGRVQPVTAGASEWRLAVAAGKQGGTAGSPCRPCEQPSESQPQDPSRRSRIPTSIRSPTSRASSSGCSSAGTTTRRSLESTRAARRTAPTSSCSTTARRSPTACRTTATS